MACTDEREGIVGADGGFECLEVQRQTRLCQQHVDVQHGLVAVLELRFNGCHLCSESYQDALDLLRFLGAVLQNAGVGLHNGLRLHKDRGAGGRHIVDDAAHLAAVLALDRHNITAVAHGDHALLQVLGGVHVAHHAFQPVTDAVLGGADLLAQVVQGVRSGVCHGVRCQNGAGDLLLQPRLRCQSIEQIVRRQGVVFRSAVPAGQVLEIAQGTCHHQQFAHGQHTTLDGAGCQLADALDSAKARGAVFDQQRVDGIGLLQCIAHFVRVALRLQRQQLFPGLFAHTAFGSAGNDLIQFQCL